MQTDDANDRVGMRFLNKDDNKSYAIYFQASVIPMMLQGIAQAAAKLKRRERLEIQPVRVTGMQSLTNPKGDKVLQLETETGSLALELSTTNVAALGEVVRNFAAVPGIDLGKRH